MVISARKSVFAKMAKLNLIISRQNRIKFNYIYAVRQLNVFNHLAKICVLLENSRQDYAVSF